MKKIYTIITTLLLAVLTANAQTVLINEDFSGLTAGTEDKPDATMLVDDMGDFINPSALKPYDSGLSYKKWGGIGLYSAGGCIAIKDGWFLNTPAGDMSGDVTITFRARLAKGQDDTGRNALDLIFLSRKGLVDFGRKTYSLTEEWQSFSFSSDKGNFETTGFQFFANTEATILLDDIRVERKQKSIQTPTAQDAENITDHSFRAVWTPTGAESYLLNVYSKKESGNTITVSEDFEAVDADSEGRLNATNPNLPEGWAFEWKDLTKPHVAMGEGPDGSTKAIRLVDEGDAFTTPVMKDGVTAFSFWLKAQPTQTEVPDGSYIQVSVDTEYGLYPWKYIDVADLLSDEARDGKVFDITTALKAFEKVYAINFEYVPVKGDNTAVLFDNVTYAYPEPAELNYALKDQKVEAQPNADAEADMTYDVTGLDPEFDYFYTVKAVSDGYVSEPSKEIEVFAVSQPTVLEPTDITSDGYTANWTCGNKVDVYRVEQVQLNTIDKDTDAYTILYEDFSKVKSDKTEDDIAKGDIEQGEYTSGYGPIDDLTHLAGWKASSLQCVDGWLGGMESSGVKGGIPGAIVTPAMDLSHNEGECDVTVRAWGTEDDWLVIQGVNPAAYSAIRFPEGGFVEATVTIPTCTKKEQLTFYSNNYRTFLIDYIKVTQNVKAGDKVEVVTGSVVTEDNTTKSMYMDRPNFGPGHDIYYRVTGLRYYHGNRKDAVASSPSDMMLVKAPATSIQTVGKTESSVTTVSGGVSVTTADNVVLDVFTVTGQKALTRTLAPGTTDVSLAPGVYIIKVADQAVRVVVR